MELSRNSMDGEMIRVNSAKSVSEVIESIKANAPDFGFTVRHVFDMKAEYEQHEVDVSDDFDLCQIMVCNMHGSHRSMQENMERAALIYQPKQITVYSDKDETVVNYFPLNERCIADALPSDSNFHKGLSKSCRKIASMIESSL